MSPNVTAIAKEFDEVVPDYELPGAAIAVYYASARVTIHADP